MDDLAKKHKRLMIALDLSIKCEKLAKKLTARWPALSPLALIARSATNSIIGLGIEVELEMAKDPLVRVNTVGNHDRN